MSKKNYYYLDASILLEENFYLAAEELTKTLSDLYFVLDTGIYREIETYRQLGQTEEALTLENHVNLFAATGNALQVNTNAGFDASALIPLTADNLVILTQQQKMMENFAELAGQATFLCLIGGKLTPFLHSMSENGVAFCPERDIYVTAFDGDQVDYVYSPRYGYLRLDKSKAYSGGEGVCYKTYNGLFCKLYFKKHISYVNYKKLQAMVDMGCSCPFISWPLDILYFRNQFVGYVMEELADTRSVDELRDDNFSGFRILDRFIIVRNFLSLIQYLHSKNILVGDMKLDNILVKSNADVYLIDAGSFQVGDYACNVCHKEYTEKIYTGDDLKHILRSVKEEYFPINKIIFEILMMKGPFYSRDNTEIDGDGSREFTYPMDLSQVDAGQLPYHLKVWFALSPAMREYFYRYFAEGKVTYVSEWMRELDLYILSKQKAVSDAKTTQ
ncbi:MAG: hypothetical protein E7585_06225 [Ruminococcaceae bacterium]|nr:hypothetical protein [Oscillospiraceae bacterium]